jgi:hypothetical protein
MGPSQSEEGVHVHVSRNHQTWSVIVAGSREHAVIVAERVRAALDVARV